MAISDLAHPQASRQAQAPVAAADQKLELLTVEETATYLKVTVSWVYEHVRPEAQDRLPAVKLGKYLRFDARDLRAYVDAKREICRRVSSRRG